MEILKFDELTKASINPESSATAGVSSNLKTNQSLKRKLIAYVSCSSIKGNDSGCCKAKTTLSQR
jgi:hypothetical protein